MHELKQAKGDNVMLSDRSTTLPTDLLILKPSSSNTKPWVITLEYGAFPVCLMGKMENEEPIMSVPRFQMPKVLREKTDECSDFRVLMKKETNKT